MDTERGYQSSRFRADTERATEPMKRGTNIATRCRTEVTPVRVILALVATRSTSRVRMDVMKYHQMRSKLVKSHLRERFKIALETVPLRSTSAKGHGSLVAEQKHYSYDDKVCSTTATSPPPRSIPQPINHKLPLLSHHLRPPLPSLPPLLPLVLSPRSNPKASAAPHLLHCIPQ